MGYQHWTDNNDNDRHDRSLKVKVKTKFIATFIGIQHTEQHKNGSMDITDVSTT